MTLFGYINTFLLLTLLSIHPAIVSAQQPIQSASNSISFTATPDNYSLLRNSQALKNEYRKNLESLPKQEPLNKAANLYCKLGDLENVTREFRRAKTAYREAESRYKATDNFLGLGRVWYGRGEIERKSNRYDNAEEAYKKANHYYERANSRQGRAAVQLALGHIKRNTVGPEEARIFYESAQDLYEVQEGQIGEANVFCALGDLECSLGNYEKSEEAYDKATSLYSKKNNVLGLANVLIEQGHLESRQDREKAQGLYNTAKEIYDQLEDKDKLGQANVAISLVQSGVNSIRLFWSHFSNFNKVVRCKKAARDLRRAVLGRLKSIQGEFELALTLYDKAEGLYRDIYNRPGLADALTGQGHLQGMLGKNDQARRAYRAAKGHYRILENQLGEAHVLCGVGWLEKKSGHLKEAKKAFEDARCLYEQLENYRGRDTADRFLKEIDRDEKLAKTDAPTKSLNKKEIATKDTENNWCNVAFSGVGPWITDKIWPFVKRCPSKIGQCIVTLFEGLWGIILTIITLASATVYKCLKKKN
ncbi:MAG: hypothetical protein D3914_03205 [Candidatus Electrothrix sp. LOE2]|nr:hypothetical protein [Candidatus Electrothrix sp. LOE2]